MFRKLFAILAVSMVAVTPLVAAPVASVPARQETSVAADAGALVISDYSGSSVRYVVYSITGQVVKSVTLRNESVSLQLPQGFYIVKSEERTIKVVVK